MEGAALTIYQSREWKELDERSAYLEQMLANYQLKKSLGEEFI